MYVLVFSAVSLIILSGLALWADTTVRAVFRDSDKAQSFMLAEAGVEYYRWHLAHAPKDYTDGTSQAGPYIHTVADKDGNPLGTFSLLITPPAVGSTVVTVQSTGNLAINPSAQKQITAQMAIPSFAKYAAVIGEDVRFGAGTELYGSIHSNGGIRMDGVAHNLVTSSRATYDDPDHSGGSEFGVHTHTTSTDPLPPATPPARPDIFMAGRQFPVAPADFAGLTQDLASLKSLAQQTSGSYWGPSGSRGYEVVFKTNDVFDMYRVTSLTSPPNNCTNSQSQTGWGTWSVAGRTLIASNRALPKNGVIFTEDHVWVRGQINTARVTVASGKFPENPSTQTSIIVNADLLYTNYTGTDVLSLVAQNNITIGMVSDTDLRIDAALMAHNGRIGRYYYRTQCSPYHTRTRITTYGMIGSYARYGFAYTDGTGYSDRIIIYDPNLLYSPPPSFPLTADYYTPIFWNESQ